MPFLLLWALHISWSQWTNRKWCTWRFQKGPNTSFAQTIHRRRIRNAFYYESFFYTLYNILHLKTCTKCKDVVLQSVQKFRCSESSVRCLDYKLNLLGASCLTRYMRRHLHVPLGLCSNSAGNMELMFVKIPKQVSKTLLLAFNVGN